MENRGASVVLTTLCWVVVNWPEEELEGSSLWRER